ncbi:hypothetical protein H4582DRAFT_1547320 [Lactarius indigo]|nr:hypothetical protein H4582DRAFT_1547320 [Lactarius indigo]
MRMSVCTVCDEDRSSLLLPTRPQITFSARPGSVTVCTLHAVYFIYVALTQIRSLILQQISSDSAARAVLFVMRFGPWQSRSDPRRTASEMLERGRAVSYCRIPPCSCQDLERASFPYLLTSCYTSTTIAVTPRRCLMVLAVTHTPAMCSTASVYGIMMAPSPMGVVISSQPIMKRVKTRTTVLAPFPSQYLLYVLSLALYAPVFSAVSGTVTVIRPYSIYGTRGTAHKNAVLCCEIRS